jgi:hypothetical protein
MVEDAGDIRGPGRRWVLFLSPAKRIIDAPHIQRNALMVCILEGTSFKQVF